MKSRVTAALAIIAIILLVIQVLAALTIYKWVDWDAMYGRPPSIVAVIHTWFWVIEAGLLITSVVALRINRGLAFLVMGIPQVLMWQTLQTAYAQAIWFRHANIQVNGTEVPSHVNSNPPLKTQDAGK